MTDKKTEALKLALDALELALDNLHDHGDNCFLHDDGEYNICFCGKDSFSNHLQSIIEKLDEALADQQAEQRPQNCGTGFCSCIECPYVQPAQQPVADEGRCPECGYLTKNTEHIGCLRETLNAINSCEQRNFSIVDMDTSPPASKPWVGLTQEDRYKAIRPLYCDDATATLASCHSNDEYEAIEAKLKEKNT